MNVFGWACPSVYTKKSSAPLFPAFAPVINWVMVHVAKSPSRPQSQVGGCCDRTDQPAITPSCETTTNNFPLHDLLATGSALAFTLKMTEDEIIDKQKGEQLIHHNEPIFPLATTVAYTLYGG